ncbi:putative beta-lysine N-acetyltransferase [Clostridium vincentii]|uniref:N-acetyltransferase YodP n=1 Tax=Clostridium vincentii TaxID=52704 RepID=A0A2T0BKI0_9CLOT|nr:putative beta-lysine N-acetyltransferase [Clostridium vincentii]PRR84343.1 N-acetyltransferase YodP [Clostridium vincentii]
MSDKIETIGQSIIHHGKENNRLYLMKLSDLDESTIIEQIQKIATENNYSKIVAKVPEKFKSLFSDNGYRKEAYIPNYYKGIEDCFFMCKYLDQKREFLENESELEKVLLGAKSKSGSLKTTTLPINIKIKALTQDDVYNMVSLYKKVFTTYPFPIFDEKYILQTMNENLMYFGIYKKDELIAISSSETAKEYSNCEMTDFAVLPEYRGKNYSIILLQEMEKELKRLDYKVLYTIARAKSYGMNITFSKLGYKHGGLLKNNTNISEGIESMNIWYKEI